MNVEAVQFYSHSSRFLLSTGTQWRHLFNGHNNPGNPNPVPVCLHSRFHWT